MIKIATLNFDEKTINERKENKNELIQLEGFLYHIDKCLKDGSIKLENGDATALINNITTYLGIRHKTIENREKLMDEELKQRYEQNTPKTFI